MNEISETTYQRTGNDEFSEDFDFLNSRDLESLNENRLLSAALFYARCGYPVIPLHNAIRKNNFVRCTCQDWRNCGIVAKHPKTRNGHKDATTNEQRIIEWWLRYPKANIGLLTGIETGIFVLDIDIKSGGEYSLEVLQEDYKSLLKDRYSPLPGTLTTYSGSGGRHLYFKYPLDLRKISGSASEIGEGLDIRANGNYIIAPPSEHSSGNKYSWFGINTPIEDAPEWLIYEIIKAGATERINSKKSSASQTTNLKDGDKIREGKRHTYLFKQVSGLVNTYSKEEVLIRAFKKNNELFEEPLPEKEVTYLVNYAYKKYRSCKV